MQETNVKQLSKNTRISKTVRLWSMVAVRMENHLWDDRIGGVPFGRLSEFFDNAVTHELDRLEGKNLDAAINELSYLYAEIGKCPRMSGSDLACIDEAISILKEYKSIKEEENATI